MKKDIRNKELSTLTPKRNNTPIIILGVTLLLSTILALYLHFATPPIAESEFFDTLRKKEYRLNVSYFDVRTQWYQDSIKNSKVFNINSQIEKEQPSVYELNPSVGRSCMCVEDDCTGSDSISTLDSNFLTKLSEKRKKGAVKVSTPMVISGNGVRSVSDIKKILVKRKAGLLYLYNKFLRKNENLQGEFTVKMEIAPSGRVVKCSVLEYTILDDDLKVDMLKNIKLWKFTQAGRRQVTIICHFTFNPLHKDT